MQETEFLNMWKSLDERITENLHLNRIQAEEITRLKIRSLLSSMRPIKVFALAVGVVWIVWVDGLLVVTFGNASPFFWWSALFQVVLCKMAVGIYLYQLLLLAGTDIAEPVLETQARLARLKATTLSVTRILFLQLPAWTTFYLTPAMLRDSSLLGLMIQFLVTASTVVAAGWLFTHIREKNKDARWFRVLFSGREWDPLLKSLELLDQTRDYQGTRTS